MPFSPAFWNISSISVSSSSRRAEGGKAILEERLNVMTEPQQIRAIDAELASHLGSGFALQKAAQDQHELRAGVADAIQDRVGTQNAGIEGKSVHP